MTIQTSLGRSRLPGQRRRRRRRLLARLLHSLRCRRRRPPRCKELNAWVVIHPDDKVVIRIARSEMGQGTLTGLAQLVAEELECDWSKVTTGNIRRPART